MRYDHEYARVYYDPALPEFAHFPETIRVWEERSQWAVGQLRAMRDVSVPGTSGAVVDIFPAPMENAPLLMHIHGGLWTMCDKRETYCHAPGFVNRGIAFATLNYTLAPAATLAEIVREVTNAVGYLWKSAGSYGIDKDSIFLSGHSAGGHLACMAAAADWTGEERLPVNPVRGLVSISGIHDLDAVSHSRLLRPLLSLDSEEQIRALSPARCSPPEGIRLLTTVGDLENIEYKRQTKLLEHAWSDVHLRRVPQYGRHHGTVVDTLSDPDGALFNAIIELIESR